MNIEGKNILEYFGQEILGEFDSYRVLFGWYLLSGETVESEAAEANENQKHTQHQEPYQRHSVLS